MLKTFFLNSTLANYGEEEFNYIQKFLLQQGILNTQGANYNDFIDLKATQNGAGDMSVNVGLGTAVLNTIRNSVSFKVFISNLASANLAITNNTSGSNRVDAVILKVSRTTEPNALMSNVATLQVVVGSGVSALSDGAIQTAIGADYDFIRLANITVANGATQILTASIADTRVRCYSTDATVPNPTIIKFRQLSADPTTPAEGEMWYNTTDNLLRYYDGVNVINIQASTYIGGNGINVTSGIITAVAKAGGGAKITSDGIEADQDVVKFLDKIPAYENLIAGDFLKTVNDNGTDKLRKIIGMGNTYSNIINVGSTGGTDIRSIFLTNSLVVIIYTKYDYNLYAVAGTVSGKTISLGSAVQLPFSCRYSGIFDIKKVSDTSFIVVCNRTDYNFTGVEAVACSVSGTTISQGSKVTLHTYTASGARAISICEIESNKFLVAYDAYYASSAYSRRVVAVSVSGTTITAGNTLILQDGSISGALSVEKFATNKAYIIYGGQETSTPRTVRGKTLTISDLTISAGSENNLSSYNYNENLGSVSLIRTQDNKLLVSWIGASNNDPTFGKLFFTGDTPAYTKISTDNISVGQMVFRDGRLYTRLKTYFVDFDNNFISVFHAFDTGVFTGTLSMFDLSPNGMPIRVVSYNYSNPNWYYSLVLGDYDYPDFLTCANSNYNAGDDVPVAETFNTFSNLICGLDYYLKSTLDGITPVNTYQKIGKAISKTKILK